MDIQDLRIFARVAAVQNLSAVGHELGLTPGTISKRLQSLEDGLHTRLFDRTTRSIRITQEGSKFLHHAERILAEIDEAQAQLGASVGAPAGRLKISAPASLARSLVAPAVCRFVEAWPDIEVSVDIADRIVNLHEEGYDAAIRWGELANCSLIAKRLLDDRYVLVASPAYIERNGAPQRPGELARHSCLVHGEQRSWAFTRGREKAVVRVNGRLQSDSGDLLHRAAREGVGILRVSRMAVAEDIARGRLKCVLAGWSSAGDTAIWAVYGSTKHVMPRLRVFLDHLARYCSDMKAGSGLTE